MGLLWDFWIRVFWDFSGIFPPFFGIVVAFLDPSFPEFFQNFPTVSWDFWIWVSWIFFQEFSRCPLGFFVGWFDQSFLNFFRNFPAVPGGLCGIFGSGFSRMFPLFYGTFVGFLDPSFREFSQNFPTIPRFLIFNFLGWDL